MLEAQGSGAQVLGEGVRRGSCEHQVKVEHESIRSSVTDASEVLFVSDEETSSSDSANDADSSASSCLEEPPVKFSGSGPESRPQRSGLSTRSRIFCISWMETLSLSHVASA